MILTTARLCTGEIPEVVQIEADTLSKVYEKAAEVLRVDYNDKPFATLTVDQVDLNGTGLLYSGILYVHV